MSYAAQTELSSALSPPVRRSARAGIRARSRPQAGLVHAPGWQPSELGFGHALVTAALLVAALGLAFAGAGGRQWLGAAWVQADAVSWTGPSLTTASLLSPPVGRSPGAWLDGGMPAIAPRR